MYQSSYSSTSQNIPTQHDHHPQLITLLFLPTCPHPLYTRTHKLKSHPRQLHLPHPHHRVRACAHDLTFPFPRVSSKPLDGPDPTGVRVPHRDALQRLRDAPDVDRRVERAGREVRARRREGEAVDPRSVVRPARFLDLLGWVGRGWFCFVLELGWVRG